MIIIADGGSTKTNWCLVTGEGKKVYFNTEGYNPYFSSTAYIIQSLKENLPSLPTVTERGAGGRFGQSKAGYIRRLVGSPRRRFLQSPEISRRARDAAGTTALV